MSIKKKMGMFLLLTVVHCGVQAQDSLVAHVTHALEQEYKSFDDSKYELSPAEVMFMTGRVLMPQNNAITAEIRALIRSKKFKNEQELFQWLIPTANKTALEQYFNGRNALLEQHKDLLHKVVDGACPCVTEIVKSYKNQSNHFTDCMKRYMQDSALMTEYINTYLSLGNEDKRAFVLAAYYSSVTECATVYESLINLSVEQITELYPQWLENYKQRFVRNAAVYNNRHDDSLKLIFPDCEKFKTQLAILNKIYKQSGNKPDYYTQRIAATDRTITYNSYFVDKGKIIGQVIHKLGTDAALFYLRSIEVIPREKIEHLAELEKIIFKNEPKDNENNNFPDLPPGPPPRNL